MLYIFVLHVKEQIKYCLKQVNATKTKLLVLEEMGTFQEEKIGFTKA